MTKSKRKYKTILIGLFGLTGIYILYHIFASSPDKFNNKTGWLIRFTSPSTAAVLTATPSSISIISKEKLDSVLVQNSGVQPWAHAYPKPAFHPVNSLAFRPNNKSDLAIEQFTIIMLTFKRSEKMLTILENLIGLPKLNKIIIVWNAFDEPDKDFKWPPMDIPIQIIHPEKNSLNNRFLPLDFIETEAILSLDDDIFVSHEDVLFAFGVWQDHRNRIVGFPGRGVRWNTTGSRWEYEPHPCSISLVLTGYAFLHKMYLSIFTHEMPQVIRDRIQNTTNCEDIAMNFLVSHISQKAPIKVTPKNEWECPKCKEDESSLWKDPKHFDERTDCINFFTQVFGYIPLFNSEYRADDLFDSNAKCTSRSDLKVCELSSSRRDETTAGQLDPTNRPLPFSPSPQVLNESVPVTCA